MNAKQIAAQLSPAQREAIRLMASPQAGASTLNDRLIGDFVELQILHRRSDGVLAFSDLGNEVLAEVEASAN